MINREQKANNFMKLATSHLGDAPEGDDINIEDYDFQIPKVPEQGYAQKREPIFVTFLTKFTPDDIEKIRAYVESHKYLLSLPPPSKISLFEDALILSEFLKFRDRIRVERVKVVQNVCEQLQGIIKRSKMTIKERLTKKLAHCSVEEIMQSIQENKPLNFIKKDKPKKDYGGYQSDTNVGVMTPVKRQRQSVIQRPGQPVEPHNRIFQEERRRYNSFAQRSENKNGSHSKQAHPAGRIYRYGTTKVKERIYIYANKEKRQYTIFPACRREQIKKKYGQEEPFPPPPDSEPLTPHKNPPLPTFEFDSPIREGYLPSENVFFKQQDDISSQASFKSFKSFKRGDIEQQQKRRGLNNSMQPSQLLKKKITVQSLKQSLQMQALFKVSNSTKYLEIIKNNHHFRPRYLWQREEDETLYRFNAHPNEHRSEIACLLRYKTKTVIAQRVKFLGINWKEEQFDILEQLASGKVIVVKQEQQDQWDI